MTDAYRILLADIGGTNARFALLTESGIGVVTRLKVADHRGVVDAVAHFLAQCGAVPRLDGAVLGVAGTVENNCCLIVNSQWMIDAAELQARFGFAEARLLNDFEALAWSLSRLAAADVHRIGSGHAVTDAPMLVVGPGTGFGAACLIPRGGFGLAIATEAGHTTLPGLSPREDAVIDHLRRRFGHVSVERTVSGPGLENLYEAIAALDGADVPEHDAVAITQAGLAGRCAVSRAALDMFCALLGTVAGNLALTFRARGGVHIGGGIVPCFAEYLAQSEFRARFEAKGRYRAYLESVPTQVIMRPDATFIGLKAFFESNRAARPPFSGRSGT